MNWLAGAAFFVCLLNWLRPGMVPTWLLLIAASVLVGTFVYRLIADFRPAKIFVEDEGLRVHVRRFDIKLAWQDIDRIEVSRYPTSRRKEVFCVDLRHGDEGGLSVFDSYRGFDALEAEIFKRWPQIVEGWKRVFAEPSSEAKFTTLWQRGDL